MQQLRKNQTIEKTAQIQIEKENDHLKNVLKRIILIEFLAKRSLAFRSSNERLYQHSRI